MLTGAARKFWRLLVGLGLVMSLLAVACSGSGGISERLMDIDASENVCTLRPELTQPVADQQRLVVKPGERIRFRVYNIGGSLIEFIVTDDAGAELRHEKLQPGIRIIDPAQVSLGEVPPPQAPAGEVWSPQPQGLASGEFAAADLAHDGHEDEVGPDATEDYTYRLIVDPDSVRNMVVTFPEVTEGYALNRAICADPDSLEQIVVTEIARR